MKACWYFAPENNRLRFGDNRLIRVGNTHTIEAKPEMCRHGLHASERIIDALHYSETSILYRVEIGGEMDIGYNKIAAQSRRYLKRYDIESILLEFARKAAKRRFHFCKPYMTSESYALVLEWLDTGNESLRGAVESAVESAAESAASAAWDAVRSAESAASAAANAAESAAESAASAVSAVSAASAAESASSDAWDAVRSAESAASAAVRAAESDVESAAWSAASAAWSAESAASAAANAAANAAESAVSAAWSAAASAAASAASSAARSSESKWQEETLLEMIKAKFGEVA